MKTWTATTTVDAGPEAVLDVLTDPDACFRWSPVPFSFDGLDAPRLRAGSRARVSGRLAGREVGFDVRVSAATPDGLALTATGPVGLDVSYELVDRGRWGSQVSARVVTSPGRGLAARVMAGATHAMLAAGVLDQAVARIAREAVAA